jgi:hypothetical protein
VFRLALAAVGVCGCCQWPCHHDWADKWSKPSLVTTAACLVCAAFCQSFALQLTLLSFMLIDKDVVQAVHAKSMPPSQEMASIPGFSTAFEQKRGFSNSQLIHAECPQQPEV